MKCRRCGKEVPSATYFKTATLCIDCFDPKNKKDTAELRADRLNRWRTSRQRSLITLIGLSIITLGIYFYYWLFINIREIGDVAGQQSDDVRIARIWFWIKIGFKGLLFFVVPIPFIFQAFTNPDSIRIPYWIWIAGMANTAVDILFFQYFLRAVAAGQRAAGIDPQPAGTLFALYSIPALVDLAGGLLFAGRGFDRMMAWIETAPVEMIGWLMLLSLVSMAGSVLWLVCMYLTQERINRIWRSGKLPAEASFE